MHYYTRSHITEAKYSTLTFGLILKYGIREDRTQTGFYGQTILACTPPRVGVHVENVCTYPQLPNWTKKCY